MLSSARKHFTLTPWKVGVVGSLMSLFFAIPFAVLTDVHTIPFPGTASMSTLYFVLLIPLISIIWALIGIYHRKRDGNLIWCFLSLFLSLSSVAFTIVSAIINSTK